MATIAMTELREYQHKAISDLRASVRAGSRAPLLQAGTGLGKTVIISAMIRSAVDRCKRVLVLVNRRQLVWQTSEKLETFGVRHGLIMAGERPSLMPAVQVASVDTIYSRCFEDGKPVQSDFGGRGMPLPPADLLVIDEAHANCATMVQKIIAEYPGAIRIGMTATPCRADSRGLGHIYDDIVRGPSVRWAMDNGYLAELRYFGPSEWDMSGVKVQAGDYNQKQLGVAVNQPKLVGDVVQNWERIAPDRTTVVFAVDRKHARALHEAFNVAGHSAEYIDGQTDNDERNEIFRRLENRESRVLCSVAVVDMGWDAPWAECAVLARPTKSLARYLQAAGRILRPAPGKQDAILIDHTGAVQEFGFVDDDFEWSLEGAKPKDKRDAKKEAKEQTTVTCPGCHAVIKPAPSCPECRHEMKAESKRAIEAKEAELHEIDRKTRQPKKASMADKQEWWSGFMHMARDRGKSHKWVLAQYKSKFGVWPRGLKDIPMPPTNEMLSWERSQRIRWAKRKALA